MYDGAWKRNFQLFLNKVDYQFDHRDDPDAIAQFCSKALAVRFNGLIPFLLVAKQSKQR